MQELKAYKNLYSSLINSLMDDLKFGSLQTKLEITRWLADSDYRQEVKDWADNAEINSDRIMHRLDLLVQKHVIDKYFNI